MTQWEQEQWLRSLGKTRDQQRRALAELLRHAAHDEMSAEDRAICRRWYQQLSEQEASAR